MPGDDVVVTGVGAVTPLGADAAQTWERLLRGESAVRRVSFGDIAEDEAMEAYATTMAVDPATRLAAAEARRMDRSQQAAMVAAAEAWADADLTDVDPDRLAVAVGTGIGGVLTLLREDDVLEARGARRVSPRAVPMLMPNAAAALVSIAYGARAGVFTPVSACSSGAEAIAHGARLIRAGEADVVFVGGTEAAIAPVTIAGFRQTRALSRYAGDPASASRPFAPDRDGFVLGEGSGMLVLESARHAAQRGARVRAVLAGAGIASDAHHITAPAADGAGQKSAMRRALAQAGIEAGRIGHVNAHATGTPLGDSIEAMAVSSVLGRATVTAPKASMGHLFGAAGAVEAIICLLSVEAGVVPPTRNLDAGVDPAIELDVVTSVRELRGMPAMSNSFGFGGQNVSLIFAPA